MTKDDQERWRWIENVDSRDLASNYDLSALCFRRCNNSIKRYHISSNIISPLVTFSLLFILLKYTLLNANPECLACHETFLA